MYVVIAYRSNGSHDVNYCGHWETEASWDSRCELWCVTDLTDLIERIAAWIFEFPQAEYSFQVVEGSLRANSTIEAKVSPTTGSSSVYFHSWFGEKLENGRAAQEEVFVRQKVDERVQELTELRDKREAIKKKAAEEAEEKKRAENREARDRQEYERLKLKYEGKS